MHLCNLSLNLGVVAPVVRRLNCNSQKEWGELFRPRQLARMAERLCLLRPP
jgi:hypothetical protein